MTTGKVDFGGTETDHIPANRQILRRFARIQRFNEPLQLAPTARPRECRLLGVAVLRSGGRTGGFHLDTGQIGERVAHVLGDRIELGAGFGLLPVPRQGEIALARSLCNCFRSLSDGASRLKSAMGASCPE